MSVHPASRDFVVQRLLDQALDEQRASWIRGERILVEDYLARSAALGGNAEAVLDLIYQEYILRRDMGENPDSSEYASRFPHLVAPIMLQFGVDAAIPSTFRLPHERNLQSEHSLTPMERIGDYAIIAVLGRGEMGVVYKARDPNLNRVVAIKMMIEGRYGDPEQRERFRSEAQAIARLRHPNIIAIHAIDEHEGWPYLSLEYADGGNLARRLAERPMAPRDAARLLETLARAVHVAHLAGVVHRDLKPSNVLLTAEGVPKVADFGLAKLVDSGSDRTLSGQVVGTPSYMAPEQAEGQSKRVGPGADIYALGAVLYHALTGRPPFLGESALETIRMATSTEAVPPRRLRPDVPRDLETICLKCLAREASKRYGTALALADDLQRYLDGRPIAARPVGPIGRVARWRRRNPWVAGLSAAVLLSMVLGTVANWVQAIRATRAEHETRKQRDRAETEAKIARAVQEFLQKDMLAQASVYNHRLRPDPDIKVRTILDQAAAKVGDGFLDQPLVEASIRLTVGELYYQLGLYPQALVHLHPALLLRRRLLGNDHPDTLLAMSALGGVYLEDGKLSDAEPLLVGAMAGLRVARGPQDPDSLAAMTLVAELCYSQEKYAEAERLLGEARNAYVATRGEDDPKTLDVTNSLGVVYLEMENSALAERTLADVLKRSQRSLGAEHPFIFLVKQNLSNVYQSQKRMGEAISLSRQAIDGQTRVLGRTHPETLKSMVMLGMLQAQLGKLDDAKALLSEALVGCRAALDRNHETTVFALAGLANLYAQKRDLERLGRVLMEVVQITRFRWGADHPLSADASRDAGMFFLTLSSGFDRGLM